MFGPKTKPVQDPDLVARVAALETKMKAIDVEWTEMFDKFRRLHMRLSKRDQRDAQDAPGTTNGDREGVDGSVNPLALQLLGGRNSELLRNG